MLTISARQTEALGKGLGQRRRENIITEVIADLRTQRPDVLRPHPEEDLRRIVGEVADAGSKIGLSDRIYLLNWVYIRLLTGLAFYNEPDFSDILNHPHLHGNAKGRHIVLAFFAIQKRYAKVGT